MMLIPWEFSSDGNYGVNHDTTSSMTLIWPIVMSLQSKLIQYHHGLKIFSNLHSIVRKSRSHNFVNRKIVLSNFRFA